ncbi:MAG: efflux RND transporter periplasmic adaptor subunit [Reyranellaceae bacterium]
MPQASHAPGAVLHALGLALLLALAPVSPARAQQGPPAVPVAATTIQERSWVSTVPAIGLLESVRGVDVSAATAGLVSEISFESGATVKAGDALVELDTSVERAELRSSEADLPRLQAEYDRQRDLAARGFAAQAKLQEARANYEAQLARIAALRALIERRVINAPFDGVLGIRLVDKGQYLQPGTRIANLQDLSAMRVRFIVAQRDLAKIEVGQELRVTVDAYPEQTFAGTITAIEPQVNVQSGVVEVQAEIPNADSRLRPGMFAKLEIVLPGQSSVLAVPSHAISYNLYGESLYVVRDGKAGADGKPTLTVERVTVKTGEQQDGMVVILEGLKPGDRVVTLGQLRLQNGSAVTLIEDAAMPARPTLPRH